METTTNYSATTEFMAKNWRDLIRPRSLDIEERSDSYGKFACEPLERLVEQSVRWLDIEETR